MSKNIWRSRIYTTLVIASLAGALISNAAGQAGRRTRPAEASLQSLNVTARRDDNGSGPVKAGQVALYANGIEQPIKSFAPDPAPSRIVLLVDNSVSIRADVKKLEDAAREFAYEIFEGDKLLIVGYDEQAEIVADWTDSSKKIEASLAAFRKKGQPHLFDALHAVITEALAPLAGQKRAIVVISDGMDRGSKIHFDQVLSELQLQDITVYSIQAPDRTGGALLRDQPKPGQVMQKLAEGTGGQVFPISAPREAASAICDELRKYRYVLTYSLEGVSYLDARRLLVVADSGVSVRAKTIQPPQ